jgi:hypothetical protein
MLRFALLLALVDYGVSFLPADGDRQFVIVYNAGEKSGAHAYKLLLRAFAPDGSIACETTSLVSPWGGRMTMKRIAWFEATYSGKHANVRPGTYLLRAYLTEQMASGQRADDSNLANNQFPLEPPRYTPVEFNVRPGAQSIRCAVPPSPPDAEALRR